MSIALEVPAASITELPPERNIDNLGTWITVDELSEYLQLSKSTLYHWRKDGIGPKGRRMGKYVRYSKADLIAWEASLPVHSAV